MVERVCRHNKVDILTSVAVAQTLERTGSIVEAVFCLAAMGLDREEIAYALQMTKDDVWCVVSGPLRCMASLLQVGVVA